MSTLDTTKLQSLVADVEAKEQALADASAANDTAQATAQSAISAAQATLATKNSAHADLSSSVDALVAYANSLKDDTTPAPAPAPSTDLPTVTAEPGSAS